MVQSSLIKLKSYIRKFLKWLGLSKKSEGRKPQSLPVTFDQQERISRSIFSPINVHKKKGTLLPNAFRPPPEYDEISVNRLDYCSPEFCKAHGIGISSPPGRAFFGLAVLRVFQIKQAKSDIVYTPKNEENNVNPYHADILIGHKMVRGEQVPAEIAWKIKKLKEQCKFYKDESSDPNTWNGGVIS